MYFIQCASGGVPVGVAEYNNGGVLMDTVSEKLEELLVRIR
jgi:hypothetical protein